MLFGSNYQIMNSGNLIFNICMSKVHCVLPGDFKLKVNTGPAPVPERAPDGRGPREAPTVRTVRSQNRPRGPTGRSQCRAAWNRAYAQEAHGGQPPPLPERSGWSHTRLQVPPAQAHGGHSGARRSSDTVGPRLWRLDGSQRLLGPRGQQEQTKCRSTAPSPMSHAPARPGLTDTGLRTGRRQAAHWCGYAAGEPPLGQKWPVSRPWSAALPTSSWSLALPVLLHTPNGDTQGLWWRCRASPSPKALGQGRLGLCTPPTPCRLGPQAGRPPTPSRAGAHLYLPWGADVWDTVQLFPASARHRERREPPLCSERGEATSGVGLRVLPQETTRRASWRRE